MDQHHRTWRLRSAFATYLVTRRAETAAAVATGAEPAEPEHVLWELDGWLESERPKLRAMLEELDGAEVHRFDLPLPHRSVLQDPLRGWLEGAFRSGALVAFEVPEPQLVIAAEPKPEAPRPAPADEPVWFQVQVVWDDTGEPVADLPLVIQPSRGDSMMRQTDSEGRVRIDQMFDENCEVRCKADGIPLAECAAFVGTGVPVVPDDQRGKGAKRRAPRAIAAIDRHRVHDGDTLESIAKSAGLTWQKLAKFNWGTDEAKAVNRHLANDVGCTRRTKDRKNYLFSSHDDPGIIFVPRPWKITRLGVATEHVLRVRREEYPKIAFLWSA